MCRDGRNIRQDRSAKFGRQYGDRDSCRHHGTFLVGVVVAQGKLALVGDVIANKKALLFIVLSGVAGALSWLFYFVALKNGNVAQVAPIDKLSVVFAVVLAVILLGEKFR